MPPDQQPCIDPEFKALIPPLAPAEYQQLEQNLIADGCRDALVLWQGVLVDGHNRLEICGRHGIAFGTVALECGSRNDALLWVIRNQLGRRNLSAFARAELALRLEPAVAQQAKENQQLSEGRGQKGSQISVNLNSPVDTQKVVAAAASVSHDTLHKAKVISERAPEAVKEKLRRGDEGVSIHSAYKDVVRAGRESEQEQKKKSLLEMVDTLPPDERYTLHHCGVGDLGRHILFGTVPVIITDPPYGNQHVSLYAELAEAAAKLLKPGGSLLVMVGQLTLPEVLAAMTPHLRYHWTLSYLTPGGQSPQIWPRKVNTFWKPVLWFTRGEYTGGWQGDVLKSAVNDNDKQHHHWGQSVSGMSDLVCRFSEPGDLILDPFLGGGTTAVVAVGHGRRFVGCDVEESCLLTTRARLMEVANGNG